MRNALLGFVTGVVTTSLAFLIVGAGFDQGARSNPQERSDRSDRSGAPRAIGAIRDNDAANAGIVQPTGTGGSAEAAALEETAVGQEDDSREARLRRQLLEARRVATSAASGLEEITLRRALAAEPVVSPVPLPAELEWVLEHTYRNFFHEQFQREPIDAVWAAATEAEFLDLVFDRPELVRRYGPPTVRCHATQCEMTFVGPGAGAEAARDALSLLESINERMAGVFDCGPGQCWADAHSEDGVVAIFLGVTRKDQ